MLILMHPDATGEQVEVVAKKVKDLGFTPHKMPGAQRIAVAITGNPGPVDPAHFSALPGVAEAVSISKPWKLVSRETHPPDTVVSLPGPGGKPSRLGGLQSLFAAYDYCAERGIGNYGGGQFELGVGRGHIQYLASLFHPDAPNDVAPAGFNLPHPPPGLPSSPLAPEPSATGFRWGGS